MVIRYFYIFFVVSKSGFLFIFSNEFRVDFFSKIKIGKTIWYLRRSVCGSIRSFLR